MNENTIEEMGSLKILRFLYINSMERRYTAGDPEAHQCYTESIITEILSEFADHEKVKKFCSFLNGDMNLPNRDNLFFILAVLASSKQVMPDSVRHDIFTTTLNNFQSDSDVFTFVKFSAKLKKCFSSGIKKIITIHYKRKDSKRLVKDLCRRKRYHSWQHKDIVKLCHFKPDNIENQVLFTYALKGFTAAEMVANQNAAAIELIDYIKKYDTFKRAKDVSEAEAILQDLEFDLECVPHDLLTSQKIWDILFPKMGVKKLIRCLLKMHKLGLLKNDNPCQEKVIKILTNPDKILESKIHPIEVYIGLRFFEKGGKPRDLHLIKYLEEVVGVVEKMLTDETYEKPNFGRIEPIKCRAVSQPLIRNTYKLSYQNVEKTGKRFLITISAETDMDSACFSTKVISCIEAAVVLTLSFLNAEDDVTVAVFNDLTITKVKIDRTSNVSTAIRTLRNVEFGKVQNGAPFAWAIENSKAFDVFINFYHDMKQNFNDSAKPNNDPFELMKKYKIKLNMPHVKLIFMNLGNFKETDFSESVLDIRGIDARTPAVMNAFIKNLF